MAIVHWLFGLPPSPSTAAWVMTAITLLNITLLLSLFLRTRRQYFLIVLLTAILQNSPIWSELFEIILAISSLAMALSLFPSDNPGRIFSMSMVTLVLGALIAAAPPPWPGYPPSMYYTRMFSTAVFFGWSLGSILYPWSEGGEGGPTPWRHSIAVLWFGAVLLAQTQRGWPYFTVGITANLIWTSCLVAWSICLCRPVDLSSSTVSAVDLPADRDAPTSAASHVRPESVRPVSTVR